LTVSSSVGLPEPTAARRNSDNNRRNFPRVSYDFQLTSDSFSLLLFLLSAPAKVPRRHALTFKTSYGASPPHVVARHARHANKLHAR